MDLFINQYFTAKKVVRIFGGRTLVVANNTNQEGYFFTGVSIRTLRKGFTSSISIVKNSMARDDITLGAFIGKDVKGLTGIKFEGITIRGGHTYNIFLCTTEGSITDGKAIWKMTANGWKCNGHYEMQVWTLIGIGRYGWESVRPTGNVEPYKYDTEEEARSMLEMCYPTAVYGKEVRISFVED